MLKKKVNLTVDGAVLESARRVAEERGTSISSLVEDFLSRLSEESQGKSGSWLTDFHRKHGILGLKEPSDRDLEDLRSQLGKKQS